MMIPKTEKIIRKKISEFDNWTDTKYSFLTMSMNTGDYSNDEQAFIWTDTDLMYSQIFETFLEIDNFRDGWTKEMSMPLAVDRGLAVYYRAEKTETLYHFGTDELGFFLSTDLFDTENIRKMNDQFWFMFSELSQLGTLDLFENKVVPYAEERKAPYLHRKSKSILYTLIQHSFALERYYGTNEDMGSIIVRWDYDIPWDELLDKGWQALRNLYRMNLELWKKRVK